MSANQVEQNCRFSKMTRRFVRLKRRVIFPNRRFGFFYVFGLKVRKAHGFGRV